MKLGGPEILILLILLVVPVIVGAIVVALVVAGARSGGRHSSSAHDRSGGHPVAGWYPDPTGDGIRYWDGTRWTEHT